MGLPSLVVCDDQGNIFETPEYLMTGMSLDQPVLPPEAELVALPNGSDLFRLPGRVALGYDVAKKRIVPVREYEGRQIEAVAAFLAPAYLQLHRAAFQKLPGASVLPLYSYTAVGWRKGEFAVCGARIDADIRQDLDRVNLRVVERNAGRMVKRRAGNRLVMHLVENCVRRYGCPAARNFVMRRWECPIPTSPACNCSCIGCISEQPSDSGVCASQERITFVPSPQEIVEVAVEHLETAPRAVISFGQGCEGEPLLVADVIEQSIREIRRKTDRGVINMNTNGSRPQAVERLCAAGLDSIRVSLNSAQRQYYDLYYRPRGYSFADVVESLRVVRRFERWSSINYFMFPGFTDHPQEIAGLRNLAADVKINMVQTRNLNMDPDWYIDSLGLSEIGRDAIGVFSWIAWARDQFPWIKLGYFNPPREEMKPDHFNF